jgi:hypothetical protein
LADVFIGGFFWQNAVPIENAPGVSIHHENRVISGIEKNGIRSLRPYAVQAQQFLAELWGRLREQFAKGSAVMLIQEGYKRL